MSLAAASILTVLLTAPAQAQSGSRPVRIEITAARLSDALLQLGAFDGVNLLFSPAAIGVTQSRPLRGFMTVEEALERLLRDTGFQYRRSADGSFLITAVAEQAALPVPEIVVTGKRSQDLDIRRTTNDVQPYRLFTKRRLEDSHAASLGEFVRQQLPSNTQIVSPAQQANQSASARSEINLHGLGSSQTLVLIDGVRMPSIPQARGFFLQSDINALPIEAIDRMEVLTQTSGGIYGTGAIGGVINVILRHDRPGFELTGQYSPTFEGGGLIRRIYGRLGFAPDEGRATAEIALAVADQGGLLFGDRHYDARSRARILEKLGVGVAGNLLSPAGVIIDGSSELMLKSPSGDIPIGSSTALFPYGAAGLTAENLRPGLAAYLPSPNDATGAGQSLTVGSRSVSVLANLRHRFGRGIQGYLDFIGTSTRAVSTLRSSRSVVELPANDPRNPFGQDVSLSFSSPSFRSLLATRLQTARLSAGLIIDLGSDWTAVAHAALGVTRFRETDTTFVSAASLTQDFDGDLLGVYPSLDPLGSWAAFQATLARLAVPSVSRFLQKDTFTDFSARVAGPLFHLPSGPVVLTALVEDRRERAGLGQGFSGAAGPTITYAPFSQRVRSLYGELRAPLLGRNAARPLAELQVATRYDAIRLQRDENPGSFTTSDTKGARVRQGALVQTAGLKIRPHQALLVRGSFASGAAPVPTFAVGTTTYDAIGVYFDPQRGGRRVGSEGQTKYVLGATSAADPERSRSLSVGVVLNPDGNTFPRLSVDFTHIDYKHRWVSTDSAIPYLIARENDHPGRVQRAALTDADRAAGFKAGPITRVDASDITLYQSRVDTVDLDLSYDLAARFADIRLYGSATWTPNYAVRTSPLNPWRATAGTADGPIRWRGNLGTVWRRGRVEIGVNSQYVGSYLPSSGGILGSEAALLLPGKVASQIYFDLTSRILLPLPAPNRGPAELRLAVLNVLNHLAPYDPTIIGYSGYADPRGRRLDLVLSTRF